jgi:hypothetical protein
MQQLQPDLLQLLLLGKENQKAIIKRLDRLITEVGIAKIKKWRNFSNKHKNTLLHELVEMEMAEVVHYFLTKYKSDININIRRESDCATPFQLANQNHDTEMCDLLIKFGADQKQMEDEGKKLNIVWLDLEMTSLEKPQIIECAVIITDKDLKEIERGKSSFICFPYRFISLYL